MSDEPAPEVNTEEAPPVAEPAAAEPVAEAAAEAAPAPEPAYTAAAEVAPAVVSAPPPMANGRCRGTVLRWNTRGFGFIKCDQDGEDGEDLFCHYSGIQDVRIFF